jgi:hypothetical protein
MFSIASHTNIIMRKVPLISPSNLEHFCETPMPANIVSQLQDYFFRNIEKLQDFLISPDIILSLSSPVASN